MVSIIGLTGGIASGKSTVASILRQNGIPVLDADDVVHQLYAQDASLRTELVNAFGQTILALDNNGINRSGLAQLVLNEPEKLALLGRLVHPRVRLRLTQFVQDYAREKVVALVIPLLFENNLQQGFDDIKFDTIWLCVVPESVQVDRLINLRGFTEADARQRLRVQMPLAEKLKQNDLQYSLMAIDCSVTIETTAMQVKRLLNTLLTC